MDLWLIFVLAGVVFTVGEMTFTGFFMAPFAVGAFAAAGVEIAVEEPGISIAVFVVITALTFLFLRPIAKKHTQQPPLTRTGTDALVGQNAIVLERIVNDEGVGCVRLGGEVWTARSLEDATTIDVGEKVRVIEIRGATAVVSAAADAAV